jgi:D-aminopeptidase
MAWYYREMSVKIPYCMICGRVGVDLGRIAGKDVALCPDCAEALMPKISALVEAAGRRPARARAAERTTPEQFRERIAASVERRGQLNVLEVARRLGFPAPKAREIAEALAQERGWQTEKGRRKLILRKPAAAPAQG